MRSCIVLEERGNIPKYSWCNGFMLKGYVQCVICMKQQQKWRHVMNTGKHMILLTRKAHLTMKVLWNFKPHYQQKPEQVETTSRSFAGMIKQRYFFFAEQEEAPFCTGGAIPLRLAFPQKLFVEMLDCVEASWPCLPPISSGWVVVGFWIKMIGQLEGTSLKL